MLSSMSCRSLWSVAAMLGAWCVASSPASAQRPHHGPAPLTAGHACPHDDSGLKLPPGFCATVFADGIGHARHMVVAPNGVVYVNTWSGRYYGNDTPHAGGFLVALQDTTGSGKADVNQRFGATVQSGGAGGTGIGMYGGALYAEINDQIVRYTLQAGSIVPQGPPVTIVSGLPLSGDHPMHPFVIDTDGSLYVDVATATNACQQQNRIPKSPGIVPCTELRDARRHLAIRREQNEPDVFAGGALRHRYPQRGRLRHRFGGSHICNPTRARPVACELAGSVQTGRGSHASG